MRDFEARHFLQSAWKLPDGRHSDMSSTTIKDSKMVILAEEKNTWSSKEGGESLSASIVAYPKLEHFDDFLKASAGVRVIGPSFWNPGAVGTIYLKERMEPNLLYVSYVQSHFKTGVDGGKLLSRSLATKYGGWRKRCLKEAILFAHKSGKDLVFSEELFDFRKSKALKKELDEVCMELKAKLERFNAYEFIIRRKKERFQPVEKRIQAV